MQKDLAQSKLDWRLGKVFESGVAAGDVLTTLYGRVEAKPETSMMSVFAAGFIY